jgi:predicted transcriptional regulator
MQIDFPPELQGKLNRIAAAQGKDSEAVVFEAVERLVGYDEWFVREVGNGVAAAESGRFVEHSEVRGMIEALYPDARS